MTARAEIRIRSQELVEPRTVRVTLKDDILFAAGDVLELQIADVTGPFVISAVREMNEANWPKAWWKRMSNEDIAAELSATFDLNLEDTRQIAGWILTEDKLSERMRKPWPPSNLKGAGWIEGEEDRVHTWANEVATLEQRVRHFERFKSYLSTMGGIDVDYAWEATAEDEA